MSKKIVIVGGHGNVSLLLAKLLSPSHDVTSTIRNEAHADDIKAVGAKPLLISLEDDDVTKFSVAFEGVDVGYFSAGAGGKGGTERTKKVDYEGAVKVFDAIEGIPGAKPRLILVSAVDVRHPDKIPSHYSDDDRSMSERVRKAIPAYMQWKYEADKNLIKRTAFKWTILRPGGLTNESASGKAAIGRTPITRQIAREDVAQILAMLLDRSDAAGLALDCVGGDDDIATALDTAVKKGDTDFDG